MYLSPIQQGIQAQHCMTDMMVKYAKLHMRSGGHSPHYEMLMDWAENHKTIVILNAGGHIGVQDIRSMFFDSDNPYAWDLFNESHYAMQGMLTCVGIILPSKFYDDFNMEPLTPWEQQLKSQMSKMVLAR